MKIVNAIAPRMIAAAGVKGESLSAVTVRKKLTVAVHHGAIDAGKKLTVNVLNSGTASATDADMVLTTDIGGSAAVPAGVDLLDVVLSGEMKEFFTVELKSDAEALYAGAIVVFDSKYSE